MATLASRAKYGFGLSKNWNSNSAQAPSSELRPKYSSKCFR